ncbi:MAG: hypothetical protein EXX96DRAFT_187631 [Benjaminiella poitrasii]|nr:MAG: hypothetical protein EXX96DRAFT_187631 [Benjaminiella poitrasii]
MPAILENIKQVITHVLYCCSNSDPNIDQSEGQPPAHTLSSHEEEAATAVPNNTQVENRPVSRETPINGKVTTVDNEPSGTKGSHSYPQISTENRQLPTQPISLNNDIINKDHSIITQKDIDASKNKHVSDPGYSSQYDNAAASNEQFQDVDTDVDTEDDVANNNDATNNVDIGENWEPYKTSESNEEIDNDFKNAIYGKMDKVVKPNQPENDEWKANKWEDIYVPTDSDYYKNLIEVKPIEAYCDRRPAI